jgi:hypothetical protein
MSRLGEHKGFLYVVRMVESGSIFKPTCDIGAMELHGSSVIATDPYVVIAALKERHGNE